MSFGYAVGDFVLLTQLAWRTVQNARQACGEHDELAREASSLHVVLQRLQKEVSKEHSILKLDDDDRINELATLAGNCERVTNVLLKILVKYNALSEDKKRATKLWKRIQFGNGEMQDLSAIRLQLSAHTNAMTLFLNLLSIGSQGNVELYMTTQGGELRKIRDDVNWITATLQARSSREGSILSSYTNDDKSFWKELRRELIKEGYSSKVLKKHKTTIKNYVLELGAIGALDELPPDEPERSPEVAPESEFAPEAMVTIEPSNLERTQEITKAVIAEVKINKSRVDEAEVREIEVAEADIVSEREVVTEPEVVAEAKVVADEVVAKEVVTAAELVEGKFTIEPANLDSMVGIRDPTFLFPGMFQTVATEKLGQAEESVVVTSFDHPHLGNIRSSTITPGISPEEFDKNYEDPGESSLGHKTSDKGNDIKYYRPNFVRPVHMYHTPPTYSFKHWNPENDRILLFGSSFDTKSLSDWIYVETAWLHGRKTPMSNMAAELRLLLVGLKSRIKRSEERKPYVRPECDREMVKDFLDSGYDLTAMIKKHFQACEADSINETKRLETPRMEGEGFVDSIFGRERQLENTKKLMTAIRLLNSKFDSDCEAILRKTSAYSVIEVSSFGK
jgi:hypothetical protein